MKTNIGRKSRYIFPHASFTNGMGSILNIAGNYFEFNYDKFSYGLDVKAIENDWNIVGKDIEDVMNLINYQQLLYE